MHTPRIDAFGKVSIDSHSIGSYRIIETGPQTLTLFHETEPPRALELSGPYQSKARKLTATLTDGSTVLFERAGCGCQTPQALRGPRSRFLAKLEPADA
jgi:hypothetical protein